MQPDPVQIERANVTPRDIPIIFSAPMVRALLDGRKTQTRRLATSPLAKVTPGDRLWVRETHARADLPPIWYRADFAGCVDAVVWRPSIHMPRWASRLTLIIEGVKVERLNDIRNEDCLAEGVPLHPNKHAPRVGPTADETARKIGLISHYGAQYRELWNSLHTKPGERWDDNPAVVALTFRLIRANIDATEVSHG